MRADSEVTLDIYDISGSKVRTLINGQRPAGNGQQVVWDGKDDFGNSVASGVYLYRIEARSLGNNASARVEQYVESKRMVLLR